MGFFVPIDDVRWCAALAEALSVCCIAPHGARLDEVRALLGQRPDSMLPMVWYTLIGAAEAWMVKVDALPKGAMAPAFGAIWLIDKALRDKPVAVPAWARRGIEA